MASANVMTSVGEATAWGGTPRAAAMASWLARPSVAAADEQNTMAPPWVMTLAPARMA